MKATMYTVEAVMGTLILLIGVISIFPIEQSSEFVFSDHGYNCLKQLDASGDLRYYAYNSMNSELNTSLYECLPKTSNYTFKVCSSSPCTENLPDGNIVLSSYVMRGYLTYEPRIINLWVWLK
ncbi:MAG: hypothetical protein JW700_00335 [Candidatus Aenigmarchaeota archaeon]|nr:hypothetical protein [Candidatus Aenigmarchaeota archaeon]